MARSFHRHPLAAQAREFLVAERGAVTIEFTVLVPFFIFLLIFFSDAAVTYLSHSEMYNAARDLARKMSVEELTTEDEVLEYAAQHLFLGNRTYKLTADFGGDMTVTISVPIEEAAIFGYFVRPLVGRQLEVSATVRREPLF